MKQTILLAAILALAACGGSNSNNQNTGNSKNSNASNSSSSASSTPANTEPGKNLPPTTMSVGEFMIGYDKENEGRIVTVTDAVLEEISYSSLLMRDGAGYGFSCNGSFSDYMDMKTRIDDLRYKHKSPLATVKGIYSTGTNNRPALNSCVLTDIKK